MIMAVNKKKGGTGQPPAGKFANKNSSKGAQREIPRVNQQGKKSIQASPGKKKEQQQQKKEQVVKMLKAKNETPPPPPAGAVKIEIKADPDEGGAGKRRRRQRNRRNRGEGSPTKETESPKKELPKKEAIQPAAKKEQQKKQPGPKPEEKLKKPINKVSLQSKPIQRNPNNRSKRAFKRFSKAVPFGSQEAALKLEQELRKSSRVYTVKVQDPVINEELIKGWSSAIESAIFVKPVETRWFHLVLKPDADVAKEVEALRKMTIGGLSVSIEEKDENDPTKNDFTKIDPHWIYLSNLHENTHRDDLVKLFPTAKSVVPPKKHGKIGGLVTGRKYTFIFFDKPEDALEAVKKNYSATLHGSSIIIRFKRDYNILLQPVKNNNPANTSAGQKTPVLAAKKETATTPVAKKGAAATPVAKKEDGTTPAAKKETPKAQQLAKKTPVKKEPESDEEDDDEDEDMEENDVEDMDLEGSDDDEDEDLDDEDDDDEDLDEEEDDDDDDEDLDEDDDDDDEDDD